MRALLRRIREAARSSRRGTGTTFVGVLAASLVGGSSLLIGIVLLPLVAGAVGAGPYGLWLFLITMTTVVGYGDLGVYSAIVHYGAQARGGASRYTIADLMTAGVIWSLIVAAVMVPIYTVLAATYAQSHAAAVGLTPQTAWVLVGLGATVTFLAASRPFGGALIGSGHLLTEKRADLLALVFRVVGTLVAALLLRSIVAVAVIETIATALPSLVVVPFVLRRVAPLRVHRDALRPLRMMLAYSAKSLLTSLPLMVVTSGATIVLGIVRGPTEVTYFNFAYRISSGLRTVLGWTLEPFRSALSRLAAEDRARHNHTVISLGFASATVTGAVAGLLSVSAFWLVALWVGGTMPAQPIAITAIILMLGLLAESLVNPLVLAGDTSGLPGIFLLPQALWAALFLLLAPVLGTWWGSVGVAIAVSVPLLVVGPCCLVVAHRRLGLSVQDWWSATLRPALAVVVPALVVSLATLATVGSVAPWAPGPVFVAAIVGMALLLRRRLPLSELADALRLRM